MSNFTFLWQSGNRKIRFIEFGPCMTQIDQYFHFFTNILDGRKFGIMLSKILNITGKPDICLYCMLTNIVNNGQQSNKSCSIGNIP